MVVVAAADNVGCQFRALNAAKGVGVCNIRRKRMAADALLNFAQTSRFFVGENVAAASS